MPRITKHPGVTLVDLWKREGRQHGRRWWYLVRLRGSSSSRAFANEDRAIGLEWAKARRAEIERGEFVAAARLSEVLSLHLAGLRGDSKVRMGRSAGRTGRSEEYLADLERTVQDAIAFGVDDLCRRDVLAKAQAWLAADTCAPVTKRRKAAMIKAVAETARKSKRLSINPLHDLCVDVPTMDAPAVFTIDECRTLASDHAIGTPVGLLCALSLFSGLRLREATFLRFDDVLADEAENFISVTPPTDEERILGARLKRNKPRCALLMPQLLAVLRPRWGKGYVICGPEGDRIRRLTSAPLSRDIGKHLISLGIKPDGRTFHSLRHTFAGLALACGVDSMALQLSMGHTSADLTKHYAQSAQRLRAVAAKWPSGEIVLRPNVIDGSKRHAAG